MRQSDASRRDSTRGDATERDAARLCAHTSAITRPATRGLGGARGRGPNAFSPRQRQHFKDFSPILLRLEKCQKKKGKEKERREGECEESAKSMMRKGEGVG